MIGTLRGRDTELAVLAGSLAAAAAGEGSLLVLEGPAGIGKTTLLDAAAARGRDCGMAVLRARGNPLEQDFSFGIARQAFAPLQSTEAWTELCHGPAGLAERVLSAGAPAPASGPDALYAAAHGLFQLTANQAARRPTVLCVDDVHWADIPSLRWLVGLVRRVDELPLALVVALRTGEPVADQRTLGELLGGATGVSLRLRPLDADAAATIVHAALPGAGPELTRACHAATGGNPFLLTTLLAHLKAERVEPDESATAAVEGIGPYVVARWVEQQLRRLPDGTADLARALAVLGRAATLRHAASLAGLELERAAVLTDALRAAGLAAPGAELALAHPIVAAALYDGLGPGERSVWHARAARLLAADHDEPERAAVHLLRAEPAGDGAGVDLLREAADRATARGAPETAATFLRRALAEPLRDRDTDAAVRLDLALALAAGRQPGTAELARDVVARIDDPTTRADAVLRAARALGLAGQNDVAVDLCRLVSEHPAGVPAATLARVAAELAANAWTDSRTTAAGAGNGPLGRRRTAAVAGGGGHGDDVRRPSGREVPGGPRAAARQRRARPRERLAAAHGRDHHAADKRGSRPGPGGERGRGRGRPRTGLDQRGRARPVPPVARAAARRCGARGRGRRPRGVRVQARHRDAAPRDAVGAAPAGRGAHRGRPPDEAEAALRAAGLGDPPPHALTAPMILQSRARLRLAQGRAADALTDLRDAAARWDELDVRHPGMAAWRADAVGALLSLGERAEAERRGRRAPRGGRAGRRARAAVRGAAGERSGRAAGAQDRRCWSGRYGSAAGSSTPTRCTTSAAPCAGPTGAPTRAARCGRPSTSPTPAGRPGSPAWRWRSCTRPVPAHAVAALRGLDALTTAERQIAGLAAQGFTNRQIAERLALSRRTVETHLAHAYQKLDIRSRADLAGLLHAS